MPAVLVVRRAPAGGGCRPYLCQAGCTTTGALRTIGRPATSGWPRRRASCPRDNSGPLPEMIKGIMLRAREALSVPTDFTQTWKRYNITYYLLCSLVEHSCINLKSHTFSYLDEKLIDIDLMKFLGLCPSLCFWVAEPL
ncbi:hypothetical protein GW17_00000666 [Ensete ventricosum]|nr:hypothetical protein GW17_00000666 [Ensete ventricosum]